MIEVVLSLSAGILWLILMGVCFIGMLFIIRWALGLDTIIENQEKMIENQVRMINFLGPIDNNLRNWFVDWEVDKSRLQEEVCNKKSTKG
jgi:hypothetical protein